MSEPTIICPSCKSEIKLTESLAAPLIEATRRQYEQKIAQKEAEVTKREAALSEQKAALQRAKESIDEQIESKVKSERERIAVEEAKKARLALATDLEQKAKELVELQEVLKERNAKLAEAQDAQAELIRKQRELDDAKREMELTIEKRVQESLVKVRDQAKKDAEEGLKLKVLEKEQTIASMQRKIEELKHKAEQGSQQLQGEAQELELERTLQAKFPLDSVETSCSGSPAQRASVPERSSGNRNGPGTGATAGCPSFAATNARPKLRLRSSYHRHSRRTSIHLTWSMTSGSPIRVLPFPWPSPCVSL